MKIAVILASYNGENYIREQVESILNQSSVSIDLIISDDGSSDSTLKILNEFSDSRVKILRFNGRHGSAAKNFLSTIIRIDYSQYDFVAFSDQDDLWYQNKLIHGIECIKENLADAYSSNVMAFWPSGNIKLLNKAQPQKKYDYLFESAGPGCTYIMSRKIIDDIKLFLKERENILDKIWLHDWFIYAYARAFGFKWHIDERPTMYYRQHDNNQVGANYGLNAIIGRLKILNSGKYLNQVRFIKEVLSVSNINYINEKLGLLNRVKFLRDVWSFRRRNRDVMVLALLVIVGFFK